MKSNKIIVLLMLILSVVIAGCVANSQDNQEIEDNTKVTPEITSIEDENGIQNIRIVNSEPIRYDNVRSYEVYWDWHNHTSDLLRQNMGKEIRIYCHSLSYIGEVQEVGKYYVILDDANFGMIYLDIDQITAISLEKPDNFA